MILIWHILDDTTLILTYSCVEPIDSLLITHVDVDVDVDVDVVVIWFFYVDHMHRSGTFYTNEIV